MTSSPRTLAYAAVALGTASAAAWWLLPYFMEAPQVLIAPAVVVAFCIFVVLLEVPTRRRTRALLESDAALQVATWEYSAAAWPEVVRTAPSPGWGVNLSITVLTTFVVTMVAGVTTEDVRALFLGAAWAVVCAAAIQAWFSHRDAALANHPTRSLRMTRSIVMLGDQLFILNPEPALPELGRGTHLHHCVASPRAPGDSSPHFAGTLTWTSLAWSRNGRLRVERRFPIPREHAHDVDRVVAAYTAIGAPNRADPSLRLPD
ncbi:MAG: hypothetical protein IPG17_05905 [Sandaracinaceae bacterium]|jgi:hypothetical protein|nr:hypothetical protein [Sandaracinaceae bacterium]MBP7682707.1 hypothetical protein [Deltaproteobacteria bacterium]MBK7155174.1 hypothetical protein [Sandaracinaceae bacterium]MBK7776220.1 hypothetical protein [Sandaracinaceae bacterium]MBK8409044.1 hypothetical protein [Sandaracinaceae bacterium]